MVSVSGESPHSARKVIVPLRRSRSTTIARLLAHADRRGVDVVERQLQHGLRLQRAGGEAGELLEADADQHLGQQVGEPLLEPDRARVAPRLPRQPLLEDAGDLLVGLVLHQPGEEQVARLEQGEVLLVLDVALREQARRLEVEQGRRDQQERRGLLEVAVRRAS